MLTKGDPNITGIIGDLVGAKASQAAKQKACSQRGDAA